MATLSSYQSVKPFKGLLVGESGSGKTGALASLVEAGYKLHIIDFDNGLDILAQVLPKDKLDQVTYATFSDNFKSVGGKIFPSGAPKAWANALKFLETGKTPAGVDTTSADKLSADTVLVVDTLSMASKAAMWQVLFTNQRLMEQPQIQDWGEAQRMIEGLIQWLTSDQVKCHVLVNTHITYIEMQGGAMRGLPNSLGKALAPVLPRYFNTILLAQSRGQGKSAKRTLTALPQGLIETKALVPASKLPDNWDLESGLAEFFKLAGFTPDVK